MLHLLSKCLLINSMMGERVGVNATVTLFSSTAVTFTPAAAQ